MPFVDLTFLLSAALLLYAGWPGSAGRSRWAGRLLALLLLSPALRYGSALFMFPLRLQLSEWAGSLLQRAGINVKVSGNMLIKNGIEMAIDPACMGLQMTGVSLLAALFMLIWQEQQTRRAVGFGGVFFYSSTAFGLTILSNLFRILLLVLFGAMPGTVAHEVIGLLCVVLYAWLPAWWLAQGFIRYVSKPDKSVGKPAGLKSVGWGLGMLVAGCGTLAFTGRPVTPLPALSRSAAMALAEWPTMETNATYQQLPNGFMQLAKPGVLIYLKPQPDWFSADHSPMACWKGSGYDLRHVRETVLNGHPAYVGELRKNGRVLHTAWWFSNGSTQTVSQLTMRKQMLLGKPAFALVNVTTVARA